MGMEVPSLRFMEGISVGILAMLVLEVLRPLVRVLGDEVLVCAARAWRRSLLLLGGSRC